FQTSYTDTRLAPGIYSYRVRAFNVNPDADSLSPVRGAVVGPVINHGCETLGCGGCSPAPLPTANGSAFFCAPEALVRLNDATNQTGSIFSNTPITVANFTTSFQVRLHEGTQPNYADGFTFVLQANAPTALGQGLGGLGYQPIDRSVAVKFSTFQ